MMEILSNSIDRGRVLRVAFIFLLLHVSVFVSVNKAMAEDIAEGNGHIDRIDTGQIIIDDCTYFLTSATLFFNTEGRTTSKSSLQRGHWVSFQEDGKGRLLRVTIKSQDLKKSEPEPQQSTGKESSSQGEMVLVDGVWRNVPAE